MDVVKNGVFKSPLDFRDLSVETPYALLGRSESQFLFWLAKNEYTGRGCFVELGAFVGGSTVAIAKGLKENTLAINPKVHSFDRFVWEEYYASFMGMRIPDLWGTYLANIREWQDSIEIYKGDIVNAFWNLPIEILFVDIMKSASIAAATSKIFFSHLLPKAYVVHQDYKSEWLPWIQLLMFRLRSKIVPVLDIGDHGTTVFQVIAPLNQLEVADACRFQEFTKQEIKSAFALADAITAKADLVMREEIMKAKVRALGRHPLKLL